MKDKIKKLLALSADNPSDEESYSALKKAQDFLAGLSSTSVKAVEVNDDYYEEGYNDGKRFNLNKKIDGEDQRLLVS